MRAAPFDSGVAVACAWVRGGRRVGVSLGGGCGAVGDASIANGVGNSEVAAPVTIGVTVMVAVSPGGGVATGTVGVPNGATVAVNSGGGVKLGTGVLVATPGIGVGVFVTNVVTNGVGVLVTSGVVVGVAVALVTTVAVGVGVLVDPGTVVAVGVGVDVGPVPTVAVGVGLGVTPNPTGCPPLA